LSTELHFLSLGTYSAERGIATLMLFVPLSVPVYLYTSICAHAGWVTLKVVSNYRIVSIQSLPNKRPSRPRETYKKSPTIGLVWWPFQQNTYKIRNVQEWTKGVISHQ